MNLWGWVLAYVVGFSLLQVLIYRYLSGRKEGQANARSGERALERTTPRGEQWAGEGHPTGGEPAPETNPSVSRETDERAARSAPRNRHCPRCGTLNGADGAFTYCKNCVRPLG
jgi:ribosomal protein S14